MALPTLGVKDKDGIDRTITTLGTARSAAADSHPVVLSNEDKAVLSPRFVDVTLTLDTSAYASGDLLADTQAVAAAVAANDAVGVLQSITIIDEDDVGAQLYVYLLSDNVSMGTENLAPSITDANARNILGPPIVFQTTDYYDLGGVKIAGRDGIGKVVKPISGGSSVYVAVVNGAGTPTYTASGLRLRLGFL